MIMNKVLYNIDQREDTTEDDKSRARANIGAAGMSDIPSVPSPSDSNPQPPGTASPGDSNDYSRANHVHPLQSIPDASSTTKGIVKLGSDTVQSETAQSPSSTTGRTYSVQNDSNGNMVVNVPWTDSPSPSPSSDTPQPLGTASAGISSEYSRKDHVHEKPYIPKDVYKGTVAITITGNYTDQTGHQVVSDKFTSGGVTRDNECSVSYYEDSSKPADLRPGVKYDEYGNMYLDFNSPLQNAINFFVTVGITAYDGYNLTDLAEWGMGAQDAPKQMVGAMNRAMPYRNGNGSNSILVNGIRLKDSKSNPITTRYIITMVGDYLYTSSGN